MDQEPYKGRQGSDVMREGANVGCALLGLLVAMTLILIISVALLTQCLNGTGYC